MKKTLLLLALLSISPGLSRAADTANTAASTSEPKYVLNLQGVSLETMDKAAASFNRLFKNSMPMTTEKDMRSICQAVASQDFQKGCHDLIQDRVRWLREQRIIAAQFRKAKPVIMEAEQKTIFAWQESFTTREDEVKSFQRTLSVHLQKIGDEWRVSQAELL